MLLLWRCLLCATSLVAQAQANDLSGLSIPHEAKPYVPANMERYFLALMIRTPGAPKEAPAQSQALFLHHIAYVKEQTQAGHFVLAGPVLNPAEDVRGMSIIHAGSVAEAQAWCDEDPEAKAGRVRFKVIPVMLAGLDDVHVTFPTIQQQ